MPTTKIHTQRTVPFHSQGINSSYSGIATKDSQGLSFSTHPSFASHNRSQLHSSQTPYTLHQGGHQMVNWRDHLTPNVASPNSLPQNIPFSSFPGNTALSTSVPRPSSSLSSSSDQRSIGSGNRFPAPPPKPPKPQNHSYLIQQAKPSSRPDPNSDPISTGRDISEDEEESDWEKEISEQGDVFYVVPYISSDPKLGPNSSQVQNQANKSKDLDVSTDKNTKKLSRLVRRRESKRDRGSSGGNGVSPKMPDNSKVMERLEFATDDAVDANRKSISRLPGGFTSTGTQHNNNR